MLIAVLPKCTLLLIDTAADVWWPQIPSLVLDCNNDVDVEHDQQYKAYVSGMVSEPGPTYVNR